MMNLVELGTAMWFEHENRIILSQYLLHCFLYHKELVAHGTVVDSNASMHSIIAGGKGKPYVLAKKKPSLIHKNIKHIKTERWSSNVS